MEGGPDGGLASGTRSISPVPPEPHSSVPAAAGSMYMTCASRSSAQPHAQSWVRHGAPGKCGGVRSAAVARPVQPRRTHSERAEAFVLKLYESAVPGRSAEAHRPTDAAAPGRYQTGAAGGDEVEGR